MKKALFFDIDGTLVSFETHRIPASTVNALRTAKQNGHKIFIATGRPGMIINNLAALGNDLIDGYITMNGAYCFTGDQVIHKNSIPAEDVQTMGRLSTEHNFPCIFVSEHDICVCHPNELVDQVFQDMLHVGSIPARTVGEATSLEIFQMTPFITPEQEAYTIHLLPHCESGRWFPAFSDIVAKGNSKQRGIDEIIAYFGISLEDTVAFGDGGNDISMLKHAAIGVAMGNANPEVKEVADYVTDTVDNDGLCKAMQHLQLI
ncbi:MAG: Cof-type HAD-IIB family hydrolase [Bacteroides sp.]|nr:Cof-type HAD-IIB family hydrolase [Bacteroides sp.]